MRLMSPKIRIIFYVAVLLPLVCAKSKPALKPKDLSPDDLKNVFFSNPNNGHNGKHRKHLPVTKKIFASTGNKQWETSKMAKEINPTDGWVTKCRGLECISTVSGDSSESFLTKALNILDKYSPDYSSPTTKRTDIGSMTLARLLATSKVVEDSADKRKVIKVPTPPAPHDRTTKRTSIHHTNFTTVVNFPPTRKHKKNTTQLNHSKPDKGSIVERLLDRTKFVDISPTKRVVIKGGPKGLFKTPNYKKQSFPFYGGYRGFGEGWNNALYLGPGTRREHYGMDPYGNGGHYHVMDPSYGTKSGAPHFIGPKYGHFHGIGGHIGGRHFPMGEHHQWGTGQHLHVMDPSYGGMGPDSMVHFPMAVPPGSIAHVNHVPAPINMGVNSGGAGFHLESPVEGFSPPDMVPMPGPPRPVPIPFPVPVNHPPRVEHVPFPVPVEGPPRIHPVIVPFHTPPRVEHVPFPIPVHSPPQIEKVPIPFPYPVPSPPQIKPMPYPVPVPVRQPPMIQRFYYPVPVSRPGQIHHIPYPIYIRGPAEVRHVPYPVPIRSPPEQVPFPVPSPPEIFFQRVPYPVPVPSVERVHTHSRHFYFPAKTSGQCNVNPCINGGSCTAMIDTYRCHCPPGYHGTHCEEQSLCHVNPCKNFGVCSEVEKDYECSCQRGYKGKNCEHSDPCYPSPCKNAGTCVEVGDSYQCSCHVGWIGKDCGTESKCLPINPCQNGGTCSESLGTYRCNCMSGWQGLSCEVSAPDTSAVGCGSCHPNAYCMMDKCVCNPGYIGDGITCDVTGHEDEKRVLHRGFMKNKKSKMTKVH